MPDTLNAKLFFASSFTIASATPFHSILYNGTISGHFAFHCYLAKHTFYRSNLFMNSVSSEFRKKRRTVMHAIDLSFESDRKGCVLLRAIHPTEK